MITIKTKYRLVIHPDTKVLSYFKKSWEFIPIIEKGEYERMKKSAKVQVVDKTEGGDKDGINQK